MPGTWFVGDTHFGHLKVAQIRGFESAAEHDDVIFSKWTRQVRDGDTVFVLGDISSGSSGGEDHALSILENLPGHKHLICGNHDSISSIHRNGYKKQAYWFRVFDSIRDYGKNPHRRRRYLALALPLRFFRGRTWQGGAALHAVQATGSWRVPHPRPYAPHPPDLGLYYGPRVLRFLGCTP